MASLYTHNQVDTLVLPLVPWGPKISMVSTTIKNGMNVMEAMALIAKLQPQRVD